MSNRLLIVDDGVGTWGAQRCILRIAPHLVDSGYELSLATPASGSFASAWRAFPESRIFDLPELEASARSASGRISPIPLTRSSAKIVRRARWIAQVAEECNATALLANSFWTHFDVAVAGQMTGTPTALYLHEEVPTGLPSLALRAAIGLSQAAIAVSTDVVANLGSSARISVVHNGVDLKSFSPGPRSASVRAELTARPDAPVIVCICRLDEVKQVDHVIRAVGSLEGPLRSATLAVVGDTTSDQDYAEAVVEMGKELLGDRVRFLGQREDIRAILRNADLYVLAGRVEGMPLGILEAQATGCPVVAYPAAGVRDIISDRVSGMLAVRNDFHSLARSIGSILTDSELRKCVIANGAASVKARFSLEGQAREVTAVLDSITAPGSSSCDRPEGMPNEQHRPEAEQVPEPPPKKMWQLSALSELMECVPDPLRRCASPADENRGSQEDWSQWAAAVPEIVAQRLALPAFERVGRSNAHAPMELVSALREAVVDSSLVPVRVMASTAPALATMNERGLPYLVFKGPTVARLHPRYSSRSFSDIDVLVDAPDFATSMGVLESVGFSSSPLISPAWSWFDRYCREGVNLCNPQGGAIDLHHRIPPWYFGSKLSFRRLMDHSVAGDVAGVPVRFPRVEDGAVIAGLAILNDLYKADPSLVTLRDLYRYDDLLGRRGLLDAFEEYGLRWLGKLMGAGLDEFRTQRGCTPCRHVSCPPLAAARLHALGWSHSTVLTRHPVGWVARLPLLNALAFLVGSAVPDPRYVRQKHRGYREYWRKSYDTLRLSRAGVDYRVTSVNDVHD